MSWVKLDDSVFDDPTFGSVSPRARLMHLEALAYSMRVDGTGQITRHGLARATEADDRDGLAAELVAAALWTTTDDGWQVVFMMDVQIRPDEIERRRQFNRSRQERSRRHRANDHSTCDSSRCRVLLASGSRNAVDNASSNALLRNPDPTRPERRGGGGTRSGRSLASGGSRPSLVAGRRRPRSAESIEKMRATRRATEARKRQEKEERTARVEQERVAAEVRVEEERVAAEKLAVDQAVWDAEQGSRRAVGLPPLPAEKRPGWTPPPPVRRPIR